MISRFAVPRPTPTDPSYPLLDGEAALADAVLQVGQADPVLARLVAAGAIPPVRKREPGLAGLLSIVIGQQVSTASAAAIGRRLGAAFTAIDAAAIEAAIDPEFAAIGLSRPKIRTFRAIAAAILAGRLPLDDLHRQPIDSARDALVSVSGIGPWTADIYLLFCLGHPDAFPAGDLALQEAARLVYALPARPDAKALATLSERWRPWRGAAAGILWAYYRQAKSREGGLAPGAVTASTSDPAAG